MSRFGLPLETKSDDLPPSRVLGYVSVEGSESFFGKGSKKLRKSSKPFHAKKGDRDSVRHDLEKNGFNIIAESALGISVAAAPGAYEDITGGKLTAKERLMHTESGQKRYVTHLDIEGPKQPDTLGVGTVKSKSLKIDGIVLERPRVYLAMSPSPIPPNSPKFYLRVPTDVAVALNAASAQQRGLRGEGVTIAMPDSGWYRHPYFTAHGYNVKTPIAVVPGTDRAKDPQGHGTGESANIFAIAPGAELQPIRASDNNGDLVGAIAGFLKAKELRPRIITSSWGGDGPYPPTSPTPNEADMTIATEIQDAIEQGILVVFSAANGQFSVEPQVPGVLSAGGVFVDGNGEMRASDYASGYKSPWFDHHVVPTVCGLVGLLPRAQYLMLPVPPGCSLDTEESQPSSNDPTTDGTRPDDGWALFSGTSAAAPQVAGAAAVLLGAKPNLTPAQIVEALTKTAIDVVTGHCHPRFNNPATPGADLATGPGLLDLGAALDYANLRL
ncbi:MAG TPA: S8 family serine peptidase [Xanthobacteraceae bacterium]|nr:S8 family serine peptidase [Xanthobacteraceae bacterium]